MEQKIIILACEIFEVAPRAMLGKSRKRELVLARKFVSKFLYETNKIPHGKIGNQLGYRDRSTITCQIKSLNDELTYNSELRAKYATFDKQANVLKKATELIEKARNKGELTVIIEQIETLLKQIK